MSYIFLCSPAEWPQLPHICSLVISAVGFDRKSPSSIPGKAESQFLIFFKMVVYS